MITKSKVEYILGDLICSNIFVGNQKLITALLLFSVFILTSDKILKAPHSTSLSLSNTLYSIAVVSNPFNDSFTAS
jgi:hypothetical protein